MTSETSNTRTRTARATSSLAIAIIAGCTAASGGGFAPEPGAAAPLSGVTLPADYRDWALISVAREEGTLDDVRAVLGNDVAIRAYRAGVTAFPDGAIIARIAWAYLPLAESEAAFGKPQSFVAGPPKNGVQIMVKDAARFAATGGWGYGHFDAGKAADEAMHRACFPCHQLVADRDYVFARYAP
jgi:hypothetical protein